MTPEALASHYPRILAYCRRLCHNADRAQDLAQDTMLRALAHISSYQDRGTPLAWLMRIARNKLFTDTRKRREHEDPDGTRALKLASPATQDHYMDLQDCLTAVRQLRGRKRQVMDLVLSGHTQTEIDRIIGASSKPTLSRARKALRAATSGAT